MSNKNSVQAFQKALETYKDKPLTDFLKWCKENGWMISLAPLQQFVVNDNVSCMTLDDPSYLKNDVSKEQIDKAFIEYKKTLEKRMKEGVKVHEDKM